MSPDHPRLAPPAESVSAEPPRHETPRCCHPRTPRILLNGRIYTLRPCSRRTRTSNMAATSADQDNHLNDSMTSATEEKSQTHSERAAAPTDRPQRHAGAWVESLRRSDVNRLWSELQRLVVNHPLVRASYSAGLLVEEGDRGSAYLDMTQELFVTLLAKSRFQHYLDPDMPDAEIECEVSQIELTNLLTAELRKRHPESYRLARRISTIIQSSANFRRVDSAVAEPGEEEIGRASCRERV